MRSKEADMKVPDKKYGVVAILDALGAANYDDSEIAEFLKARQVVMQKLDAKTEQVSANLNTARIKTYTFNDTVLVVQESDSEETAPNDIQAFVTVLRRLVVDSLGRRILFRGSFAAGSFYEDSSTNTILGKAVTDAAAWYDKADWIGILATPRTTVLIDRLKEQQNAEWDHLLADYKVPLSAGKEMRSWTVNWPKGFWVNGITPCKSGEKPREVFLKLLSQFHIPLGAESKHFNTISFFDYVAKQQGLKNKPFR